MKRNRWCYFVAMCMTSWSFVWSPMGQDRVFAEESNPMKTPVIDIATPVEGISHNHATTMNVGNEGLIFNNATTSVQTVLDGKIDRNRNLTIPAKLIIQEIEDLKGSDIQGPVEVAGTKSSLIMANQNGIRINGGTFINTNEVDIVGGRVSPKTTIDHPIYEDVIGSVDIGEKGLVNQDGTYLRLIGCTVSIGGPITTPKGEIVVKAASPETDGTSLPAVDIGKGTPSLVKSGIRVETVGSMYGQSIVLVTEEEGSSIVVQAPLHGEDAVTLVSKGDITLQDKAISKDVQLKAQGHVNIERLMEPVHRISSQGEEDELGAQVDSETGNKISSGTPTFTIGTQGRSIIHILAPNEQGISNNIYPSFHVLPKGSILNNSVEDTRTTLGDEVKGNPNLQKGPARIIINEVEDDGMGANASILEGPLEVAGAKANVIVANPNGIYARGLQFINVRRGTLMTGKTDWMHNRLMAVPSLQRLHILGQGVRNPYDLGAVDLMGGDIHIDGALEADTIHIQQGDIPMNYTNLVGVSKVDHTSRWNDPSLASVDAAREESGAYLPIGCAAVIRGKEVDIEAVDSPLYLLQKGTIEAEQTLGIYNIGVLRNYGVLHGKEDLTINSAHVFNYGGVLGGAVGLDVVDLTNDNTIGGNYVFVKAHHIDQESMGTVNSGGDNTHGEHRNTMTIAERKHRDFEDMNRNWNRWNYALHRVQEQLATMRTVDVHRLTQKEKEELARLTLEEAHVISEKEGVEASLRAYQEEVKHPELYGGIGYPRPIIWGKEGVHLQAKRIQSYEGTDIHTEGTLRMEGIQDDDYHPLLVRNEGYIQGQEIYIHGELHNAGAVEVQANPVGSWKKESNLIEIDEEGSEYNHVIDDEKYFEGLGNAYNYTYHRPTSKGDEAIHPLNYWKIIRRHQPVIAERSHYVDNGIIGENIVVEGDVYNRDSYIRAKNRLINSFII